MTLVNEFNAFGDRFEIEPPIEVGDQFIDSLGKLAMIAAKGYDYDPRILEGMAGAINNTLDKAYDRNGTDSFAWILTEFVATRDRIHNFTRS
jgi:hypothetical protein